MSKWSSSAVLPRPVTKIICSIPASSASSTAYWMSGRSTTVSISLGTALVAGRKRVPRPATGKTAFLTFFNIVSGKSCAPAASVGRGKVEGVVLALLRAAQPVILAGRAGMGRRCQKLVGGRRPGGHGGTRRHALTGLGLKRLHIAAG